MALTETWLQHIIDQEFEGVELVALEQSGGGRQKTVRLYIDHGDGVTHGLCGKVSEVVGRALDDVDALSGPYVLEVSSPGLERPLRKRSHFEAQVGKRIYVKTRTAVDGKKAWQGTLLEVAGDDIVVADGGQVARIQLGEIVNAHLVCEF